MSTEENSSYQIVRSVAGGFVEAGIVADIVEFGDLESHPFAIDRLVLITPRGHPAANRRNQSFRSMLDYEFVGLAATNALQQHIGQHAVQAGKPIKLRVRLGSFDAVCRMVGNDIGIAIIPETAARMTPGDRRDHGRDSLRHRVSRES
jgi:DNA-binding transcriptional LysR family regulator